MKHLLYCDTVGRLGSVGFLVLRLVMGVAFVLHGWTKNLSQNYRWNAVRPGNHSTSQGSGTGSKIQNPFGWMPPEASVSGILQALAALSEFGGGMALILGLLTRLASLGIASVMVVALGMVHLPHGDPFVSPTGGRSYELAAVYLACAVLFLLMGPGRFSLDALLFGNPLETKPHRSANDEANALNQPTSKRTEK